MLYSHCLAWAIWILFAICIHHISCIIYKREIYQTFLVAMWNSSFAIYGRKSEILVIYGIIILPKSVPNSPCNAFRPEGKYPVKKNKETKCLFKWRPYPIMPRAPVISLPFSPKVRNRTKYLLHWFGFSMFNGSAENGMKCLFSKTGLEIWIDGGQWLLLLMASSFFLDSSPPERAKINSSFHDSFYLQVDSHDACPQLLQWRHCKFVATVPQQTMQNGSEVGINVFKETLVPLPLSRVTPNIVKMIH